MKNLWTVFRFELLLSWRGAMAWLLTLIIALVGMGISMLVNQVNDQWWGNLCLALGLLTLLLALTTGNQIQRDSERRLDGIVLSTPLATGSYVLGKYLAGLFSLLVYAGVAWLTFVGNSYILCGQQYYSPVLGPNVYIQAWLLLVLVPVLFAASLTLFGLTWTRGHRALISVLVVIIWMVPYLVQVPKMLTISFYMPHDLLYTANHFIGDGDFIDSSVKFLVQREDQGVTSTIVQQMVHLYQTVVIPEHLTLNLLINRVFFLSLSIFLLICTLSVVHRQRQGKM
ncbi:hypothetical protein KSC_023320 [Ktedonobacter sp. SOSP1-52]|uniref:hypothetical protein n=1 Tax=Ktedonobacter sp. SOSP1-52 TaxID=2778366 RepID=UPI001916A0B3|nr:hypothetical protein [Ktedonobacter sp. SOSP1-52]GHO63440.1 hypothetical protein KSC_023320 [Ktedonobacter sp. SOSP1-52]